MNALTHFYQRYKQGLWLTVLAAAALVAATAGTFMSGKALLNAAAIIMLFFKLALLVFWNFVVGGLNDFANRRPYSEDRKLIENGNVAVALVRCIGFAAPFVGGAVCIFAL